MSTVPCWPIAPNICNSAETIHMQVHLEVLPLCPMDDSSRALALPSPAAMSTARVVICTCGGAGMLREGDYGRMHPPIRFSHVMIDEAGQASRDTCCSELLLFEIEQGVVCCFDAASKPMSS